MGNSETTSAGTRAGGRGRLARVIATRGGKAAPEAPFVIEHREALIYMLCEAAELEHGIMCQYLFAAFSLKQSAEEGLSGAGLAAVRRWRAQVLHVAGQEMLHLALVHNLLSAIGAAPHLARPNLPAPASHYPAGVHLALIPFGEQALRHFMFLERPEGMDLADADGLAAMAKAAPLVSTRDIVPQGQDFATVGHLYRSIEEGFRHLADKHGEDWLFVGPPRAQATAEHFGWPELVPVPGLASACAAIEEILEQGEGPRGHWRDAHFGQFVTILDEYLGMREADPGFDPVRPVLAVNVRPGERDTGVPLITDRLTARVADLFNVSYEILLQILERFFAHTEETDAQLTVLSSATVQLMVAVIKPLGDLITTLPVGEAHPGRTAGPSFELFYENDYLMPHREAAWALLAERLDEAAWLCDQLRTGRGRQLAGRLEPVLATMRGIAATLAGHLPAGSPHAPLAEPRQQLVPDKLAALAQRAGTLAAAGAGAGGDPALAELVQAAHSIVARAATGDGCGAAEQAMLVPRLVDSVLRPLAGLLGTAGAASQAGALPGRLDGSAEPQATDGGGTLASRLWELAKRATAVRANLGRAGTCPPEVAEAVAALQDLAARLAAPAEAEARRAELWHLHKDLPPTAQAMRNGPYLVTNVPRLTDHLGAVSRPLPQLALCRCGASAIKPLCDGSHASNGFSGAKDANRAPDRRDTYHGVALTVLDNRGICQHSGLCTDRLGRVFRSGAEPFVAPSGGRADEIIRAVRDCPSGALSYAIDGTEARAQVDWAGTREPAIEVTKDGPYRITGAIALLGADGAPEPRSEGASAEHYALCRCGHSQNKPFCSGMHWYVQFRDPVPTPGSEPGPFEWAGGLPALTRVSRLLYEKHVPADPLLAPAFGQMPPDQPQRLAGWLAAALGGPGPASNSETTSAGSGDLRQVTGFAEEFSEQHRARWAALLAAAADDAMLPAEPAFRSVFAACADWLSRAALAQAHAAPAAAQGPAPEAAAPPVWSWGPGSPPAAPTAAETGQQDTAEPPLPGPGETVSFAAHIKPLFRQRDRQSMSFAFDLWSRDDVRARAQDVLARLQDGSMPCDSAWPPGKIETFRRWTSTGMQP
jgi:CDGSH-type Zn-finger protein/truncated hemoglobin YjbI